MKKDTLTDNESYFDVSKPVDCTPNQEVLDEAENPTKICDKNTNNNREEVDIGTKEARNKNENAELLLLDISEIKAEKNNQSLQVELKEEKVMEKEEQKHADIIHEVDLNENINMEHDECEMINAIKEPTREEKGNVDSETKMGSIEELVIVENKIENELRNDKVLQENIKIVEKEELSEGTVRLEIIENKEEEAKSDTKIMENEDEVIQEAETVENDEEVLEDDKKSPKLPSKEGEETAELDTLVECSTEAYAVTWDTLKSDIDKSLTKDEAVHNIDYIDILNVKEVVENKLNESEINDSIPVPEKDLSIKNNDSDINDVGSTCSVNGVTISETSNIDKIFMQPMLDDSKSVAKAIIGDVEEEESQESGSSEWLSSVSECGCGEIPKVSIKKKCLKLSKSKNKDEKKAKPSLLSKCQGRSSTPRKVKGIQKNDLDFSLDSPDNIIKVEKDDVTTDTGFATALTELPQLDKSESKENFSPICRKAKRSKRKDRTPGRTVERTTESSKNSAASPNDEIMKIFESKVETKEQSPKKFSDEKNEIETSNPEIRLLKDILDFESPVRQLAHKAIKKDKVLNSPIKESVTKNSLDVSNPEASLLKNILDFKSPGRLDGLAILKNSNKVNTESQSAPVSKNKKKLVFDDAKADIKDTKNDHADVEKAPDYTEFCRKLNTDIDTNVIKNESISEEKSLILSPIKEFSQADLDNDELDDVFEEEPVKKQKKKGKHQKKENVKQREDKKQKRLDEEQKRLDKEDDESFDIFIKSQKKEIKEEKNEIREEKKEIKEEKNQNESLITFIKTNRRGTVKKKARSISFQESEEEEKQRKHTRKKKGSSAARTEDKKDRKQSTQKEVKVDEKPNRTSSTKEKKVLKKTTDQKCQDVSNEEEEILSFGIELATKRHASEKQEQRGRKCRNIPLDEKLAVNDEKVHKKEQSRESQPEENCKSRDRHTSRDEEQRSTKREKRKDLSPEEGGRLRKRSRSNKDSRGSTSISEERSSSARRSIRISVAEPKNPSKKVSYKDRSDSEERSEDFVSDEDGTDSDDKPMIFIKTPPTLKSPRLSALRVTYSIDKDAKKKRLYSKTSDLDDDLIHSIINSPLKTVVDESKDIDSDDYEANHSSSMLFETKQPKPKRKLRPRVAPVTPNKSNPEDSDFEPSCSSVIRSSPVRKKGRKILRDKTETSEKILSMLLSFELNSSVYKSKTNQQRGLPGKNIEKLSKSGVASKTNSPYDTSLKSRKKERNNLSPSHFDFPET